MATNHNEFDIILRGGRILDGTGGPWFLGDVGISRDRIAAVDNLAECQAAQAIDVSGKMVCPGFIDVHVHSEIGILTGEAIEPRVRQGITTDLLAPDGLSFAPLSPQRLAETRQYLAIFYGEPDLSWEWSTLGEYLDQFDRKVAMNVVPQVALNAVRAEVVGWDPRPATPDELEGMKQLIRQCMEEGASGIQTGLEYYPSAYADTEELIELCKVAAEYGGVHSSHLRGYGTKFFDSADEAFRISEEANIPTHFCHLSGFRDFFDHVERAKARGIDITFDMYPYTAGCTHLVYVMPPWMQSGTPEDVLGRLADPAAREELRPIINDWFEVRNFDTKDVIFSYVGSETNRHLLGQSLGQAVEDSGKDLTDFACDILQQERLRVLMVFHWHLEEKLRNALTHPQHMFSSDGVFHDQLPHPRGYGAFPRALSYAVKEKGWLRMEEAVRKMTSFPAQRYRLQDRGLIRPGMAADVVVFDPERITDRGTYEDGRRLSEGMEHVIVNGDFVLRDEVMTDATPGRALRKS